MLVFILAAFGCGSAQVTRDASIEDSSVEAEAGDEVRCNCPFCTYCAETEPVPGTACPESDMKCEYGKDLHFRCNRIYSCEAGVWSLQGPAVDCPSDAGLTRPLLGTMYLQCNQFNVDCMGLAGCNCPVHATPYTEGCDAH
ncbi:hypothetical protein BH09MYX1_BH09MYX1_13440 [soil metagenome]